MPRRLWRPFLYSMPSGHMEQVRQRGLQAVQQQAVAVGRVHGIGRAKSQVYLQMHRHSTAGVRKPYLCLSSGVCREYMCRLSCWHLEHYQ
mmetsp:Transcript_47789/g.139407  ORF Transcript_47789/g.139407 Transcript_47789/m.139407 type:complete len:90 (+) Transcript_47789:2259-2528(+)